MVPEVNLQGHDEGDKEIHHVYVDNYILAVVQEAARLLICRVADATLHGIHSISPPPCVLGHMWVARIPSPKRS
jgi:hypothetical protein